MADLRQAFGLDEVAELPQRYNIAPTQSIAVIRQPRRLELLRWGLMLPDARARGPGTNVRVETVARAPAYRDAFRQRRCLVIVDGFFEWQRRESFGSRLRFGGPTAGPSRWPGSGAGTSPATARWSTAARSSPAPRRALSRLSATSASALRDVVRGALGPAGRDKLMESIRAAHQRAMSRTQLTQVTRTLAKPVQKSVVDAFDSADVINLPEGNTAWRASNAISWVARHTQDDELRLDLERVAGALV